ncbi:MAG: hypothetical protein ACRD2B_10095 [Terriglobia bacterium]
MALERFLKAICGALMVAVSLSLAGISLSAAGVRGQAAPASQGIPPQPGVIVPGQPGGIPRATMPNLPTEISTQPRVSLRQKDAIVRANFRETKQDVAKLFKLTQALQQEIAKTSPNVLSLSIVGKANKIEKLAKKIKNEAKAY